MVVKGIVQWCHCNRCTGWHNILYVALGVYFTKLWLCRLYIRLELKGWNIGGKFEILKHLMQIMKKIQQLACHIFVTRRSRNFLCSVWQDFLTDQRWENATNVKNYLPKDCSETWQQYRKFDHYHCKTVISVKPSEKMFPSLAYYQLYSVPGVVSFWFKFHSY